MSNDYSHNLRLTFGRVDIDPTQRYLTLTPELLSQASNRFEQYAAPGGVL